MVIATIVIAALGALGMLACLAFKPSLKIGKLSLQTFWMPPLIAAIVLLSFQLVPWDYFVSFLIQDASINPLEILALFLSMAFLSILLDEAGFFSYLASYAVKKAGNSQFRVFLFLYILTSVLTVFTSNDIIILTFTPFIVYFTKRTRSDPIPYLVGEFVAANTWSMLLLIGNPTNIYLAESFSIPFLDYFLAMWPSALAGGLVSLGLMLLLFHKKLKIPFITPSDSALTPIRDHPLMWASLSALLLCLVFMALSNFLGWPLWLISVIAAGLLFLFALVYVLIRKEKGPLLGGAFKRLPYEVIPFVLSMFVLVLSLKSCGVTASLAGALDSIDPIWSYGLSSFLAANLVNNIPMSVLFTEVIRDGAFSLRSVYASIVASNVGAILTPVGALAGIMWMGLLKSHGISYSFRDFVKYGALIGLPTLAASLAALYLI